jgi:hypothetical protein
VSLQSRVGIGICDELREGDTCLTEATDKLKLAVEEARADKTEALAQTQVVGRRGFKGRLGNKRWGQNNSLK